jgi:hypothetical protein
MLATLGTVNLSWIYPGDGQIRTQLRRRSSWCHTPAELLDVTEKAFSRSANLSNDERTNARNAFAILSRFPELIEVIGVLESEGALTLSLIDQLWGPAIVSFWRGWEPVTRGLRRLESGEPEPMFAHFERLATTLAARRPPDSGLASAAALAQPTGTATARNQPAS